MKKLLTAIALCASLNVQASPADSIEICKSMVIYAIKIDKQIEATALEHNYAPAELKPAVSKHMEALSLMSEANRMMWVGLECELVFELYSEQFVWESLDE